MGNHSAESAGGVIVQGGASLADATAGGSLSMTAGAGGNVRIASGTSDVVTSGDVSLATADTKVSSAVARSR